MIDTIELNPAEIRDLRPLVLDGDGRMRVLPAAFWESTTVKERALFGNRTGVYSFPTVELVDRLRDLIAGRTAIEIGAGHGVLAEALGIPATDNFQQLMPKYQAVYGDGPGQIPAVRYGPNVVDMHASRAVRRYKPQVVIGCWVTHKYEKERHEFGGNEIGVDEEDILRHCEDYIVVGNTKVHATKKIWTSWKRGYTIERPPYLYSRAHNGTPEFIAVFKGAR